MVPRIAKKPKHARVTFFASKVHGQTTFKCNLRRHLQKLHVSEDFTNNGPIENLNNVHDCEINQSSVPENGDSLCEDKDTDSIIGNMTDTKLDNDSSKINKSVSETDKSDNGSNIDMEENSMMSSITNLDSPVDEDVDQLNSLLESCSTWNSNTSTTHSFPDLQAMVLLALLSRLNALLNYQSRKKYKLPVLTSTSVMIDLPKNKSVLAYVNMPSDHLKLLATNPMKAKSIFAIPDCMSDQFICLQQDFWSGDVVEFAGGPANAHFLVESFHMIGISAVIRVKKLLWVDASPINIDFCFSMSSGKIDPILPVHRSLLLVPHFLKWCITQGPDNPNNENHFYKVRIAPITLFTDDTSGSRSKQYDPYKSWSMKCAALFFKERSSIENIYFLSAIPKKDDASGMSLLPVFVKALTMLENRLVMFLAEDNKHVLVVAPLFWIEADTPYHSKICGLHVPTCLYSCHKCYIMLQRTTEKLKNKIHYMGSHASRTKEYYQIAASTPDRSSIIPDAPSTGKNFKASELSFRYRATDILLHLDSFDLSTNTPIEILHNILLGVAKYLVTDLVNGVLKGHPGLLNKLMNSLKEYRKSQGLSQKFARLLGHCSLFLGRDFKILIQILPIVLATKFNCGIKSHKSYTLKPKVYLLTHLLDNFWRFETALYYETKKRLNISRDICLKFAKLAVMRHIIDDVSKYFYTSLFSNILFFYCFVPEIPHLSPCNNIFGVFALKESRDQPVHYIIEKVSSLRVEHYRVESSVHSQENNFFLTQRFSNNLTTLLNQLTMICKLDIHIHYDSNLVINLNKLGSYWFFASQVYNRWY
ncbi:hypothetical protein PHYBLDRAFT_62154 [Phycomyces blakesleeanus NRRL 1555(-)]|uniref:C2H2-type zinc finger transcription factor n=2 Tax=Phycomyces blakesleeanus TaxID=4837 RepID=A0A162Q8Y5_PHYB8|nr:hypothetical protein PHYBLDRAFT_62154 [Phycomyces blakesleeanus NRRL 1555(-)]OAD81096.1 hypothetical protein PHYBLDRAFT_62154 [Phycomyces blakesleeanus NRRL 1555(-)]|eukprot:XP_018299136.1 hypothetical protein PHYBLDRAFT_62154 [Phycomyces blakesleeanus NRRL 1555(-)]